MPSIDDICSRCLSYSIHICLNRIRHTSFLFNHEYTVPMKHSTSITIIAGRSEGIGGKSAGYNQPNVMNKYPKKTIFIFTFTVFSLFPRTIDYILFTGTNINLLYF